MEVKIGEAVPILFGSEDDRPMLRPHNDTLVITTYIAGVWVARSFVDTWSSVNYHVLRLFEATKSEYTSAAISGIALWIFRTDGGTHW